MAKNKNTTRHEPLFHIAKRGEVPFWNSLLIRVAAIALALLFSMLLTVILLKAKPGDLFSALWKGSFATERKRWKLLKDIAMLLCISLAVTPCFRMRFWNIGAEGQVLVASLATAACIFYLGGKIPDAVLIPIMLIAAMIAGMIWSGIPAIFKAVWNTNETLFTLMMNYVASFLTAYFLLIWIPNGSSSLGILKYGHLPQIGGKGKEYLLVIIIVALLTVFLHVYLKYSKHGYELTVVGESEKTARYIGINVPKTIIRTMLFAGMLCGIAGFLMVGGVNFTVNENSVGGLGFTAIMVAWLAKFKPFNMVATSFLMVFLDHGVSQLTQDFDITPAFPNVIVGILLFFIIGCEFFINYKIIFRKKHKEAE